MERKRLPVGISDYKTVVAEDYYYVDKTDFIRQLVEEGSLITLLPRPRRFGKTLNLSMLRYFFEQTEGNVFRSLFNGTKIEQWKDFAKYQGKYPVIMITLKDCKGNTFQKVLEQIAVELAKEFKRHQYLLEDNLSHANRRWYTALMNIEPTENMMQNAFQLLSNLLTEHWGIPPLVLLDEYDTPIHAAYDQGFYEQMIDFMRNFMSTVFKDNTDIFRGVITGILRISKESLFSGLNNIDVDTLLDEPMSTAFGFTQEEVDKILANYDLEATREKVKEWYNGYLFAGTVIYNPWSIINYISKEGVFASYWVNSGSDVLLRCLVANGPMKVRQGIASLIQGETIRSVINDKLAFPDLLKTAANIWSFMLFSGYLKVFDNQPSQIKPDEYTLAIPNYEIAKVFDCIIQNWIDDGPVTNERLQQMLQALRENNMNIFQRILNDFVVETLSFYDAGGHNPEKVYQAFLLGMLVSDGGYEVSSNRESGLGRYDILLRPRDLSQKGIVMELKLYDPMFDESVEAVLDSALNQINERQYISTLRAAGVEDILKMAVTFDGKRVWVKTEEEK